MQQVIRLHPASFKKIFPDRQVNNIYFDSPHFTCFNDNVAGVANRVKFRIRWYGDFDVIKKPKLEIKIKKNQLGRKLTYDLPAFELENLKSIIPIVRSYNKTGTPLVPVLLNSYRRAYYGTTDQKFRITTDQDLYFQNPTGKSISNSGYYKDEATILELKYDAALDSDADRIMQYLPFRQTKSSKYVTGVNFLFG